MQSEPKHNPKGFKAMLEKTKAAIFSPIQTRDAVVLEAASQRATDFLTELDTVLARSQAAQKQRMLKQ